MKIVQPPALVRPQLGRRSVLGLAAALAAAGLAAPLRAAQLNEDGLHVQPWFLDSFLDLADDLAEAQAEGKALVVMVEQRGCPYCTKLHEVTFADPDVAAYMQDRFAVVQLNLAGSRGVTDFDGDELEERAWARKHRATFTPTLTFHDMEDGQPREIARLPGYLPPEDFMLMARWVGDGAYRTTGFAEFARTLAGG